MEDFSICRNYHLSINFTTIITVTYSLIEKNKKYYCNISLIVRKNQRQSSNINQLQAVSTTPFFSIYHDSFSDLNTRQVQ